MANVRCPICAKEFVVISSDASADPVESGTSAPTDKVSKTNTPPLPFCSKRCQMVDLDGWFSERYAVAGGEGDGKERGIDESDTFVEG